jgi:hypothetical protein
VLQLIPFSVRRNVPEQNATTGEGSVSRAVARAYADSSPLDGVLDSAMQIPTKMVERDLKAFVADELRRLG